MSVPEGSAAALGPAGSAPARGLGTSAGAPGIDGTAGTAGLQVPFQPLLWVTCPCFSPETFTNVSCGFQGTERSQYRCRRGQGNVCQARYFGVFRGSV